MDEMKILDILKERQGKKSPTMDELASELNLEGKELTELIRIINNMEITGQVVKTKKGRLTLPENLGFFSGRIQLHAKGFGFLIQDKVEGEKARPDIFLPPDKTKNAMNGDTVLVKVDMKAYESGARDEGEVVRIIARNTTTVIGVYQESANYGFVVPEDKKIREDIFIPKGESLNAKNNDVVVCELTKYPSGDKNASGKVISVLGRKGDPGVDMMTVLAKYNLPQTFPQPVLDYVDRIPNVIPPQELERRRDLRGETIVTIDGADAKDLDDAISVVKLENGNYKLGVHIADVTHYVKEKSVLDEEALKRATSVYLIDLVIPMLPQKLSNDLCSLNPNTDKLTLSCEMEIDSHGTVKQSDVFESVIRTTARMTYDDVNAILTDHDEALTQKYEHLVPMFREMEALYEILNRKRMLRGAIDFDFTESYIVLDENGEPVDVRPFVRGVSNRIIEEFMLAANECVAETYHWQNLPFVYRIHEDPDPEKLQVFSDMATTMGVPIRFGGDIEPMDLQKVLANVKGTDAEHVLSKLLLRSMMQAKYSPNNLGHFGLAAKYYSHFTSPIRRYPDLQIHRIIKKQLNGQLAGPELERYHAVVAKTSLISSEMERVAEEAEREVDDMKKAQYMHARLGQVFEGVISSVTSFGFFVELPNTIEGLVHINTLPMDVMYDDRRMILTSDTYGTMSLGDRVRVQVAAVDVDNREINFEFLGRISEDGEFTKRKDHLDRDPLILGTFQKSKSRQTEPRKESKRKGPGFFEKKRKDNKKGNGKSGSKRKRG